jgi:hypothetical protein
MPSHKIPVNKEKEKAANTNIHPTPQFVKHTFTSCIKWFSSAANSSHHSTSMVLSHMPQTKTRRITQKLMNLHWNPCGKYSNIKI